MLERCLVRLVQAALASLPSEGYTEFYKQQGLRPLFTKGKMMKTTQLQELIDFEKCMAFDRYAGGHDEQMQNLFKGATVLAHWNEGDYQGAVATAVRLEDGRFCWYQDSYGSCSGCDAWEDCTDDEARQLLIGLAIDAEVFDTLNEMLAHMIQGDAASWRDQAGKELHKLLTESDQE